MKRVILTGLTLLLFFSFISSAAASSYQEVTLSDGDVVEVSVTTINNGHQYEIRFPSGNTYFWKDQGHIGTGGGSSELTTKEREQANEALNLYKQQQNATGRNSTSLTGSIAGVILIMVGLMGTISPRVIWYLQIGWKLNKAEPSDLALLFNRIGGIVLCIVGVSLLF
ncbi:DUF6199 family natural product biosynthesis protein [Alkalihalophilus marmarensis]|uniref:DUF6199 family natural product biosynthesis protein n=1 Tax=Alkalihalophilus marmarensis TaxID=521377 RepID=UPI002DB8E487|nr:DUF6199 family natural product biosynthesis protein [Alkalihalophilus marmarensis]MEC2074173.1 hypothetical protein [Alkalihalophilus marmarensis]